MLKAMLVLAFSLTLVTDAAASISSFPWSSTFNCSDDITYQGGVYQPNCPDYSENVNGTGAKGCHNAEIGIYSDANNAAGGGGRGLRKWICDGMNAHTGGMSISFSTPQPELYIRWYMRYEAGFQWQAIRWHKLIYLSPAIVFELLGPDNLSLTCYTGTKCGPAANGKARGQVVYGPQGCGWNTLYASGPRAGFFGNRISDGSWHAIELHVKMETSPTANNGIWQVWVDGVEKINVTNVNFNNGAGSFTGFLLPSNEAMPANGKPMYVDFDDLAISTTGPIGLLGSPVKTITTLTTGTTTTAGPGR